MRKFLFLGALLACSPALAGTLTLTPTTVTEWKAVYGRVEARNTIPARARIGGLIVDLAVTEGDLVKAGQKIATVQDDKIAFQVAALDAQLRALQAQLATAQSELARGQTLVGRGVVTVQRVDQLRTEVDVARNQLAATEAQRSVIVQQGAEGDVFAPGDGRVLSVPVTRGAVIMAGEVVATIGGGGVFLRLAVPERYAATLKQGAAIRINAGGKESAGRLAKIYPQIDNGRVIADVEVDNLDTDFIDARVLVQLPVGERSALLVPAGAVETRSGIDFVRVAGAGTETERAVVTGERMAGADGDYVEIMTGLAPGDVVVTP
ncbi:efflux RND transporter periplasmic adaptor subunit [Mesorhizobium sp.]|uniref:efflux RND transporter periplasmic adaptor subunit n=1 Tax=Mesorhizobium sp. TaxID=1871066 RepID=UPI001204A385|nr:efflux RND transporter periplasmic adaptor subunit [Mesorhizobium sp.]TIO04551.1 MAG: efflux RND transporter periplasmic adaptor subunit [Mesorhizobium sp.]TIO32719.1 MAG: efflux RND transporter periplasmic adaptor subunit [Mesorhizobium sp.]TIP13946.1 MAG: efflux RND transporter periplasmic adaptor subunit [Mesorhizobium sp.]